MLLQNYLTVEDEQGREVIKQREAQVDGLPPGRSRITSPYDTDARWGAKRDTFWNGYKVHVTETCDTSAAGGGSGGEDEGGPPPNLIVNMETTDATVPDSQMTAPVHACLARRGLLPAEHYVDSGYPSAELLVSSLGSYGIALVTPMLADTSPQARAGAGYDRAAFTIAFDARQATCPQGHASTCWNPVTQRGTDTIVITFAKSTCGPCPVRAQCTTSASGRRQLTVYPRQVHEAQLAARAAQDTIRSGNWTVFPIFGASPSAGVLLRAAPDVARGCADGVQHGGDLGGLLLGEAGQAERCLVQGGCRVLGQGASVGGDGGEDDAPVVWGEVPFDEAALFQFGDGVGH